MASLEEKIQTIISETVGSVNTSPTDEKKQHRLSTAYKIREILLISTPYDYFLLEEEGRLSDLFKQIYVKRNTNYIPYITHVDSTSEAAEIIQRRTVDLIVIFNIPRNANLFDFVNTTKSEKPRIPIILLANNTAELTRMVELNAHSIFDWVFTWQGDGKIFLNIVSLVEDTINAKANPYDKDTRYILLSEPSIQYYSMYVSLTYDEIWNHIDELVKDVSNPIQMKLRLSRRPKILLATSSEEEKKLLSAFYNQLLCIITSKNTQPSLNKSSNKNQEDIPLLLITNKQSKKKNTAEHVHIVNRKSREHIFTIRQFVRENLGLSEIVFKDADNKEHARAHNMRSFEHALWSIPDAVLVDYAKKRILSRWLITRTEFELAAVFNDITAQYEKDTKDKTELRSKLQRAIQHHKYSEHEGTVSLFSRTIYGPHIRFSRIGHGALGGKARGLAFLDKLFSTYLNKDVFDDIKLTIPRTLVLSTDIYDTFIEQNNILQRITDNMTDERITSLIMQCDLPSTVLGDLRAFIKEINTPLAVRSSSLLEDALFQPFAGVYSSIMLPNHTREVSTRFQDLCNAIKYVYASTFFRKAKDYIKTTPQSVSDEKMGVVIQEVIGRQHGNRFYPTISGVARSYNYYPVGKCNNEDGVAFLALGLGRTIVEGGKAFRFCPSKPRISHYSTLDELIKYSQTHFFTIDLNSKTSITRQNEEKTLSTLDIATAEKDGELNYIASTFSSRDQRLYSGITDVGARVLDFAPVIQDEAIPLPKIITLLLKVCEVAIGSPVEIEFAVTLDPEQCTPAQISLLQVRSMVTLDDMIHVKVEEYDPNRILGFCQHTLGNGIINNIKDILYVKPESFDLSKTASIVPQIRDINEKIMEKKRPYLLVGPGRWGSQDTWLGIPVNWSDIAGSKVIVETPVTERIIDPSEGSHFFQNLSSLRVGYLTIQHDTDDYFNYDLLANCPIVNEKELVRHVQVPHPLEIRLDGQSRRGVILLDKTTKSSKKTKTRAE